MIARTTCPTCNGVGHVWTGEDVKMCPECKSDGTVPARDAKGRFIAFREPAPSKVETR